jgi:hypothetical protein
MGHSYSVPTIKALFAEAADCAYPGCGQALILRHRGVVTAVAQIAHIRSERPDGPRFEPSFPVELIDHTDNLLLLCGSHHRAVDDSESAYPTIELLQWKADQISRSGTGTAITDTQIQTCTDGDWVPLESAVFHLISTSQAQILSVFQAYSMALQDYFKETPAVFTSLLRPDSIVESEIAIPVLAISGHHREPLRAADTRFERMTREYIRLVGMARDRDSEQQAREEAASIVSNYLRSIDNWQIFPPEEIPLQGFTAVRVSYEPELKRVTFDRLTGRRNLRDYHSRLLHTSDALEYFAAISERGLGIFEAIEALEECPAAVRMVAYMLDSKSASISPFRIRRDSPETWDFWYHEFDTEVEERRLYGTETEY